MSAPKWLPVLLGYALVAAACWSLLRWYEPLRVTGSSMRPALHAGDLVLVAHGRPVRVGDVALLRGSGSGSVVHRVIATDEDGSVRTRGDANRQADAALATRREIVGPVVRVVPVGRLLNRWRGE